jgi:glycosyltransferase involved in cell wall biosynthesis
MTPRTSVIIPVYNTQAYLHEALESVAAQTRPVREVIIIDDGSRVPVTLTRSYKDLEIRIYRTVNRGLPSARNLAAELCRGEFFALLDSDDVWHSEKIAIQEDALDKYPHAPLCFTQITYVPPQQPAYHYPAGTREELLRQMWHRNYIYPSTVMIRRQAWFRVRGEERHLWGADDWELWWRLAALGPFVYIPQRLTYYRRHPDQMTKNISKMCLDICRAKLLVAKRARLLLERVGLSARSIASSMRQFENGFYDYITYHEPTSRALPHLLKAVIRNPSEFRNWLLLLRCLIPDKLVRLIKSAA